LIGIRGTVRYSHRRGRLIAYTEGKWAMMGGELAGSCKQEMMVTSWEGVGDGDTGYYQHCHAAMSCFKHWVVSYPSFSTDSNRSMAWWSWLSFTVSLYYPHSPESNVSLSMSRATMCASSRWQQVRWYKSVWHFMLVCFNWRAIGRLHEGIYFQHHK